MTKPKKISVLMRSVFADWKFPFDDTMRLDVYDTPSSLVPHKDPRYSFPEMETLEAHTIISKEEHNNLWVSGPTGSGKSTMVRQYCARTNTSLYELTCHTNMTTANLFGKRTAQNGSTGFAYAIVVKWLRNGGLLLANELSTLDPDVFNALKSVLEFPRFLTLTEHDDEVIIGHPDCKFVASDNTTGRGDDSGQFVNVQTQSIADMRRFNGFVNLDYISKEQEEEMLKKRFPGVPEAAITGFVKVANMTRSGFKNHTLGRVLSTAEVINWCENYSLFATAHRSARVSFLNSYEPEAATAVREAINVEFGNEDGEVLVNAEAAKRASDKTEA